MERVQKYILIDDLYEYYSGSETTEWLRGQLKNKDELIKNKTYVLFNIREDGTFLFVFDNQIKHRG